MVTRSCPRQISVTNFGGPGRLPLSSSARPPSRPAVVLVRRVVLVLCSRLRRPPLRASEFSDLPA